MKKIPESRSTGGLVLNVNGEVLLVQEFGAYWELPRGHVEEGENDIATAAREIYEESGITQLVYKCDLGGYSRSTFDSEGTPNYREIKHLSYYCFTTPEMNLRPIDGDITDAKWVAPDEARSQLINQEDIQFFDRSIEKIARLGLIS